MPTWLSRRQPTSPHAHARILGIDTSRAEALDGVKCVITHDNLPGATDEIVDLGESVSPYKWVLQNVLASDKALYQGHAVAAVCVTDPHIAEDALDLIDVEYEVLTPVLTVHDAMAEGAPILHDGMKTVEMVARFVPGEGRGERETNIASQLEFEHGDPAAGFEERLSPVEREILNQSQSCSVVGTPDTIRAGIAAFAERTGADEVMIVSHIFDHAARLRSLAITAEQTIARTSRT